MKMWQKLLMEQLQTTQGILDEEEKKKICNYYQSGNQWLREVFDKFITLQDVGLFKQDLVDLLLIEESKRFDDITSPVNQEYYEQKMLKLKNFRFLLNYYYEIDKLITLRQLKTLNYLYLIEDISLLAAYEVYCVTKNQNEFQESINLIYKLYSLGNHILADIDLDEIEQFDQIIYQQLNILFMYRNNYTVEQRSGLELNVRTGDNTLLKLYKEFVRHKKLQLFIDQTRNFANERSVQLKRIQQILIERRQKRDEQKTETKEMLEKLHTKYLKNSVRHLYMLLDSVDQDSILIKSAFEVYKFTKDKQDLEENIKLIYNQIYKINEKNILKSLTIELQLSKLDLTRMLKQIEQEDPLLKGAFELFFITHDEVELKDTIGRIVKFQQ